jgi:hypothetical protein
MDKSITVTILFDEKLQKITGDPGGPCPLNNGATFGDLFDSMREISCPEIFEKYKPGELWCLLNGKPIDRPTVVLMDGDVLKFFVV